MRSTRFLAPLFCATAALALAASPAAAQAPVQGLALDRFDPAPAGDRMFGVPSPYASGSLTPHVMVLGSWAHNPLVLRRMDTGSNVGTIVTNQLFMHIDGGIALWNRVNVDVDVPVALFQSGTSPMVGGTAFSSPTNAQFGDLRFGLRVRLWGEENAPFQIGVGGYLWLPTGSSSAFVGDGKVRGMPQLIVGGQTNRLVWSTAVGPEIRAAEALATIDMGSMFKWGGGLGVLLLDNRHLQLGAETSGAVTFRDVQKHTTNVEVMADGRYRVIDDVEIGVGVGPGLTSGIGTPDVRGVLMVSYSPERASDRDHDGVRDSEDACPDVPGVRTHDAKTNGCPSADRDGDGIIDAEDACPDVKGIANANPKKNGCPKEDRDGDGVADEDDACPDVRGVASDEPKLNGCPVDRDGDGILDGVDACLDVKGVPSEDPKKNGCPPDVDTDGDGIVDAEDACPNEKGARDADPKKNGCPKAVRMSENEILILEQVQFDTGKATIKAASDALLDEVAAVLKQHPEILRLEVQGHTDDRGVAATNRVLSQARAAEVVRVLVKRGIAKDRLTAKGFGQDKPIAPNATDEGRQKNRRVEFAILEKKPKSAP